MYRWRIVILIITGSIFLYVATLEKQQDNLQESQLSWSEKDDPYESIDSYNQYKKYQKSRGKYKLESPEIYAEIERQRRTPNDRKDPEYEAGHKLKELHKASAKNRSLKINDLNFIERGPGNVAGRTRALLVLPGDSTQSTWLAGSASGGIWKTTDAGQSWTDKTADLPNLGTNTLAMSASDPNIIYAGTGEHFTRDIDGSGLFKSVDQGETWEQIVEADQYDAFRNVSRIAVHPENPDIVLATTRNSVFEDSLRAAIYKSVDGGMTWELQLLSTSDRYDDIAVNPQNFNTIYVAVRRRGVIKSTDGGGTWVDRSVGMQVTGRIEIAASTLDTNYVWGLAQGGASGSGTDLYLSTDAGETWKQAIEEDGNAIHYLTNQGWYDNVIEPHPFNRNEVYVGGVNLFKVRVTESDRTDLIYDLVDFGAFDFLDFINGANVGGGILEGNLPTEEVKSVELRFGAGGQNAHRFTVNGRGSGVPAPDYEYLDVVPVPFQAWDTDNDRQLMISFRDQAEDGSWTLKNRTLNAGNTPNDSREYIFVHDVDYAPSADSSIAVDGGHEFRQLYFMWPVLRNGAQFDPTDTVNTSSFVIEAKLTVIQDAATTVLSDAYDDFNGINGFSSAQFANNRGHHPDQHSVQAVIVDSAAQVFRLISTNDGGVYLTDQSQNPGSVEDAFNYAGFGFNTTQFYSADKVPGEDRYIGGMQDNSTWFTRPGEESNAMSFYQFAFGGDGFEAIWNNRDPNLVIGSVQFNSLRRSTNGGQTWRSATSGINDTGPFVSRVANSRALPDRLFTVGTSGVWVSTDFGLNWESRPINAQWSFNNSADVEVSPANPKFVMAGGALDENQRLFVSTDGGDTFTPTNFYDEQTLGSCSGFAFDPDTDSTAYALFSFARRPKVIKTTDLGQTWVDITGFNGSDRVSSRGFPDVAVNCLLVFPNNTDRIWVGTEIGIVESLDGGQSWGLLDANLPSVNVADLKIQDDQIIVATYGRGIWSVQIDGIERTHIFPPSITSVVITPSAKTDISLMVPTDFDSLEILVDGATLITIPTAVSEGEPLLSISNFNVPEGTYDFVVIGYLEGVAYESFKYTAQIFTPLPATDEYFNNFTVDSLLSDFIGDGFQVTEWPGFEDKAIHSEHNYADQMEVSYLLKRPIIVSEEQTFRYRDIAIIELGEEGSSFGSSEFFDFVVVEGSKDALEWIPLADGYDSSFEPAWVNAYNNNRAGNAAMFIRHELDLKDSFAAGDTIFIRYRLFADPLVNGWGWVIDDVEVRLEDTTPVINPVYEETKIFPNPAREFINLQLPRTTEDRKIVLTDITGQTVYLQSLRGNLQNWTVPVSQLTEGIYILEISEGNQIALSEKIVIID